MNFREALLEILGVPEIANIGNMRLSQLADPFGQS